MSAFEGSSDRNPTCPEVQRGWLRVARLSGNPLLRRPSRRERWVRWLTWCGLGLLAAVLVVVALGVYRYGAAQQRVQSRDRHQVTATVADWTDARTIGNPYLVASRVDVTYPFQGKTRKDTVTTTDSLQPGDTMRIWIDGSGRIVQPPRTSWTTWYDTALTLLLGGTVLAVLVAAARTGYDGWLVRRHLDEWETEWVELDIGHRR